MGKIAAVSVTAALLVGVLGPAAPANAADTACPARATVPNIAISRPYVAVNATLASSCQAVYASWDIYNSAGLDNIVIFDPAYPGRTHIVNIYDWQTLGAHQLRPGNAWNADYEQLPQATGAFAVKLGSVASIGGYRSSHYVHLRAAATRYYPTLDGFRPWTPARVTFQYRLPGYATWNYAGTGYTASTGYTPYVRVYAPTTRYFRAVVIGTSSIWQRETGAIAR